MFANHGIVNINASDHNLVFATRKQPKVEKSYKFIWCRSYRRFEPTIFERDVIFTYWNEVMQTQDSNTAWNLFVEKINTLLDIHVPYRNIKVSDSMPKWVTAEFIQACDEWDYHLKCYRRNKNEANKARMKRS